MSPRRGVALAPLVLTAVVLMLATPSQAAGADTRTTCFGKPATIIGTPGPDDLVGGPDDVVVGLGGDDSLYGSTVCGGTGHDYVYGFRDLSSSLDGGDGNDYLEAYFGPYDVLLGGAGDDRLLDTDDFDWPDKYDPGLDIMKGGPGNDRLESTSGRNRVFGNAGDDVILDFTHVRTYVSGGAGNDTINATYNNWGANPYEPDDLAGDGGLDAATVNRADRLSSIEQVTYVD